MPRQAGDQQEADPFQLRFASWHRSGSGLRVRRSAASSDASGRDPAQAPEIARRAYALVARAAGQARRRRPTPSESSRLRHGADRSASVGPYSPTTGTSDVAATCSGPLSPPTNNAARSISARSSASDQPSPSRMRRLSASGLPSRLGQHTRRRFTIGRTARHEHPRRSPPVARREANSANDASGHRRNGLPALTCSTTTRASCRDLEAGQPLGAPTRASRHRPIISTRSIADRAAPPTRDRSAASRSH